MATEPGAVSGLPASFIFKIIFRHLSRRHVDYGIIIRTFILHVGHFGKLRNHHVRIRWPFITETMHIFDKFILIADGFFRMLSFAGNPLREKDGAVNHLAVDIKQQTNAGACRLYKCPVRTAPHSCFDWSPNGHQPIPDGYDNHRLSRCARTTHISSHYHRYKRNASRQTQTNLWKIHPLFIRYHGVIHCSPHQQFVEAGIVSYSVCEKTRRQINKKIRFLSVQPA